MVSHMKSAWILKWLTAPATSYGSCDDLPSGEHGWNCCPHGRPFFSFQKSQKETVSRRWVPWYVTRSFRFSMVFPLQTIWFAVSILIENWPFQPISMVISPDFPGFPTFLSTLELQQIWPFTLIHRHTTPGSKVISFKKTVTGHNCANVPHLFTIIFKMFIHFYHDFLDVHPCLPWFSRCPSMSSMSF